MNMINLLSTNPDVRIGITFLGYFFLGNRERLMKELDLRNRKKNTYKKIRSLKNTHFGGSNQDEGSKMIGPPPKKHTTEHGSEICNSGTSHCHFSKTTMNWTPFWVWSVSAFPLGLHGGNASKPHLWIAEWSMTQAEVDKRLHSYIYL